MLPSKNKIITPSPLSKKKGRRFTPMDIAWQRACADCCHMTPEEEEERNKRIADIKKRKDEMSKLCKEFEEMDDEVTSMVKEINEMKNRQSSASVEKIYNEMVKTYTENEKKRGETSC